MTGLRRLTLLSTFFLAAASTAAAVLPTIEVVESSDSGMTLRYRPAQLKLRDEDVGQGGYTAVSLPGVSMIGVEGAPELPVVTARLAVPHCETIDLSVETSGSRTLDRVRVVPSPTTVRREPGGISDTEYLEGPSYDSPDLWPGAAARMFGPSEIGTQRVLVVEIYPCQARPSEETLVSHDVVEVRVSFGGLEPVEPPRGEHERREALLSSLLLNYEEGKAWRARRQKPAAARDDDYFTTSSNWGRLTVRDQGIHAVTYDDMLSLEADPSVIDPSTFRIFSGGGLPVPGAVTLPRPSWMGECTIHVAGGDDGTFDQGDKVVFYGLAVDGWVDELDADYPEPYYENPFANDNVYWLTWETQGTPSGFSDSPLRMEMEEPPGPPSPVEVDDYHARSHFEANVNEYQGMGDDWFWFEMKRAGSEEKFFHERLDHVRTDSTGTLRGQVRGNSSNPAVSPDHYAVFYLNDAEAAVGEWEGYSALMFEAEGLPIREGYNTYKVLVPREGADYEDDRVLIDWFEIEYWRELWADDDQLRFGSSGRTGPLRFSMGGFESSDVTVYRITDKYTQSVVGQAQPDGDRVVFVDVVPDSASYVAVGDSGYRTPALIEIATPGALRSATGDDYIMITYDGFQDEAARLAGLRESEAGGAFSVRPVNISEVYDEFSWGLADPAAIRDFLKYTYDNEVIPPTHALLIGDTSSDYRQYLPSSTKNYVPTYYTGGGGHWPTEQWFVGFTGTTQYQPAMALGRLPVRSTGELRGLIDKIIRYETETVLEPWKNTILIVADDEFKFSENPEDCCEFFHTSQAESLSREVLPWPFDREKVYLMEYERDLAGHKTEARNDIIETWNEGLLIVNYTGHGNETLMAHEYVFLFDDVARLTNIDGLPLYFAASCRLNKFDMPTTDSLGEMLVQSASGGAIISIGSTRDSGASQNSRLNGWFYSHMFGHQRLETRAILDVGLAFQAAFMEGSSWYNNTKFCIIGDPAVMLASPRGGGSFEEDGLEPMRRRDTVELRAANGGASEDESGVALIHVSDTADTSGYLHTTPPPQRQVDYVLPGKPVFEGAVAVAGGELESEFVVSALAEEGPYARIRAYFYGDDVDGAFSVENVALSDSVDVQDDSGPDISMEFEGGGTSILPGTPLAVTLHDESGINLVDRTSSDGIVATVTSEQGTTTENLTDQFVYDLDSHERGSVYPDLSTLSNGEHTLVVSASDNMGNRASASRDFEIVSAADFTIRDVANYPNPFPEGDREGTTILFQLPTAADVTIQVFTVGGRLIRVLDDIAGDAGANQIYWDGLDQEGDELANGVYLYRIHAVSRDYRGDKAEAIGRAVVMR